MSEVKPSTLKVAELRAELLKFDIDPPKSVKKAELIDLLTAAIENARPQTNVVEDTSATDVVESASVEVSAETDLEPRGSEDMAVVASSDIGGAAPIVISDSPGDAKNTSVTVANGSDETTGDTIIPDSADRPEDSRESHDSHENSREADGATVESSDIMNTDARSDGPSASVAFETEQLQQSETMAVDENSENSRAAAERTVALAEQAKKRKSEEETDAGPPATKKARSRSPSPDSPAIEAGSSTSFSTHPPTRTLYISNLRRPCPNPTLSEYLESFGELDTTWATGAGQKDVSANGWWTDGVREHCYVTYTTSEAAIKAATSIHGVVFPPDTGAALSVQFLPTSVASDFISLEAAAWQSGRKRLVLNVTWTANLPHEDPSGFSLDPFPNAKQATSSTGPSRPTVLAPLGPRLGLVAPLALRPRPDPPAGAPLGPRAVLSRQLPPHQANQSSQPPALASSTSTATSAAPASKSSSSTAMAEPPTGPSALNRRAREARNFDRRTQFEPSLHWREAPPGYVHHPEPNGVSYGGRGGFRGGAHRGFSRRGYSGRVDEQSGRNRTDAVSKPESFRFSSEAGKGEWEGRKGWGERDIGK